MEFYNYTDIGKKRKSNQDCVDGMILKNAITWAAVCDGMGGTNGGDIASKTAVEVVKKVLNGRLADNLENTNIKQIMIDSVKEANCDIYNKSQNDETLSGMGTTIVLSVVYDGVLHLAYVGDSRCYLITNTRIKQLSKDHSVVQELVDSGEITADEAKDHPQKNIITRALGVRDAVKADYKKVSVKNGDVILMCTDGLTNHVSEDKIFELCHSEDLKNVPEKLINEANDNGGSDNITVALIKI